MHYATVSLILIYCSAIATHRIAAIIKPLTWRHASQVLNAMSHLHRWSPFTRYPSAHCPLRHSQ